MTMNRQPLNRILFLASMCVATTAFAGSEIIKCIDAAEHVTLTDQACDSASVAAPVEAMASETAMADEAPAPVIAPKTGTVERVVVARSALPRAAKGPVARSSLALDVAMLKVARLNLQVSDHAAAAMRQQRLARLD
jgi:hypothetical protein